MEEVWKNIKGFEELYQVSSYGRIKSLARITKGNKYGKHQLKEKILKPIKSGEYYCVVLRRNNKNYIKYIHRIVAENFIENLNNYTDVNHKNGEKHNNNVENLEWCSRSYNIKHAYNILKRKKNLKGLDEYRESHKRKVIQYNLNNEIVKNWDSISQAEKVLNIKSRGKICECCQQKRKSAFGYIWRYYENTTIPK